ncbi:MAG: response regulator [bacterium]|nr:response regulator [bacterium]
MAYPYVVIGEDDEDCGQICTAFLERSGYEVLVVKDGEEVLKAIHKRRPDILLLDLLMPKKNGFDVLEEIRKDQKLKDLKVVVFSNLQRSDDVDKAMSLGAKDFLYKSLFLNEDAGKKLREYL